MSKELTDEVLKQIEQSVRDQKPAATVYVFADDALRMVAEIRRLREENTKLDLGAFTGLVGEDDIQMMVEERTRLRLIRDVMLGFLGVEVRYGKDLDQLKILAERLERYHHSMMEGLETVSRNLKNRSKYEG